MMAKYLKSSLSLLAVLGGIAAASAETADTNAIPPWLSHPMSMKDAIDLALQQNGNILRGKSDLEA